MGGAANLSTKNSDSKSDKSSPSTANNNISPSLNSPVEKILDLQRTVGNHAVQKMFESGAIQAKLKVGHPNDIYEQEADRVAETIQPASGGSPLPTAASNKVESDLKTSLATTQDGYTAVSAAAQTHPNYHCILAHEKVHRSQFASHAPSGSRQELELDAQLGSEKIISGEKNYVPMFSAQPGTVLAYGEGAQYWFPNLEQQSRSEERALEQQELIDPQNRTQLEFKTSSADDASYARARYDVSVSASGNEGQIQSVTTVILDYDKNRSVSVVGPAVIQVNPEIGLGPVYERPAYPYVLTYTRTIKYTDNNKRTALVEVDGHVFISEKTLSAQLFGVTPSYEALLSLMGDNGYITASVQGSSSITSYFASYASAGNSLSVQSQGAVSELGHRSGLSGIDVSQPASFVDPRTSVGIQYQSLRAFLLSADAAELARKMAEPPPRERSWFEDLTKSIANFIGGALEPLIDAIDSTIDAIVALWNDLPPWARGILTAVGKFAAALLVMAVVAALIVEIAAGAVTFGVAMLALGVLALAVGFAMSFISRIGEAWNSDNRWRLLLVPTIAALDTLGISGIIESVTDESILTGTPLNRTEEEQWEAGTTGVLQLVGIFLLARGMRGSPRGRAVTAEVRGPLQDFHALPTERLPVLPEGHYWVRQGPEWVLFREPMAPEVPIEISIYSDGQGNINYNIRSGGRVLQGESMTRPSGNNYQGGENRLPPELRGTGENNPFIEEGTNIRYEKGHLTDYVDRIEGPNVRSSNADVSNFTPQARNWNSFLRNHIVSTIRGRSGGYREMPIYESNPSLTVNETPIPSEFIFVETSPTGQARAAWRIPNNNAIPRQMSQLPQYGIQLSEVPSVMFEPSGTMRPPGTFVGPFGQISGMFGNEESNHGAVCEE